VRVIKQIARESAIYGGADFLTKLLAFVTFPIMAAALSAKDYGVIELVITATGLLSILMNCGINNAVQRFYWDGDQEQNNKVEIVTSGFILLVCLGAISLALGLGALPWVIKVIETEHWPISGIGLIAAILLMIFSQITTFALDVVRLHFWPWKFLALSLLTRILTVSVGLLAVVLWRTGPDGLFGAQALIAMLMMPIAIFVIKKELQLSNISAGRIKEIFLYGYPFIFASLTYWLLGSLDRWMLAAMSSIEDVGIFSIAFRLASILTFVIAAFSQAWSPQAIKIKTDYAVSYRAIYGDILLLLMLIMIFAGGGLALFAGELTFLFIPKEYQESALPLLLLCIGIILQSTQQITAIGISIERKTHIFIFLVLIAVAVNFLFNLFLIPNYGAVGAAWSTLAAYAVLSFSHLYATQKIHHLVLRKNALIILLMLILFISIISIIFLESSINIEIILIKLIFLAIFMIIGFLVVRPWKFKYEKH
jgi:O-antigen/teichoic acid export membrane protein